MPSVTFSIPEEIKLGMKQLSWVNWSELARQEVLIWNERTELFKELEELTKDSTLTDADCLRVGELVKEKIWKRLEKS